MSYDNPFIGKPLNYIPTAADLDWLEAWEDKKSVRFLAYCELERITKIRNQRKMFVLKQAPLDERLRYYKWRKAFAARVKADDEERLRRLEKAKTTRAANKLKKLDSRGKPRIRVKSISIPYYEPQNIWTPERQYREAFVVD